MIKHDPYISKEFAEGKIDRKLRMLEGVARILSDNYNVTVVFSPDGECKTSQEVMTLPYDKELDEALILGLCGHETGHLKYTEFGIAKTIARHKQIQNRALLYVIFNVLEDVRIEYEMEQVYAGFKEIFKRLIPYIKLKKQPALNRAEKIKRMMLAGNDIDTIEATIKNDCKKERDALEKVLRDGSFSEEYIKFEIEQLKKIQETPFPEVQKVLDVVYLMLRKYDHSWYPIEITQLVKDALLETAKEIYNTKNSQEVLNVAIKIYQLLIDLDETLKQPPKSDDKNDNEGNDNEGNKEQSEEKEQQPQSRKNHNKKGKGKGKDKEESKDKSKNSTLQIKPGEILKVGSKVTHLQDSSKTGIITRINNELREIEVEWDE